MRLLWIFIGLSILLLLPLAVFEDRFDRWFAGDSGVDWLRSFGVWAGVVGVGLLCADLFLPIPATAVMAALGIIYGPWLGGVWATTGSFLAGALPYGLTWLFGLRVAAFLIGERNLAGTRGFFDRSGAWAVALSRWLPLLPEVIACLAGLTRMHPCRFFPALACGSLPMGFAFAALGAWGSQRPMLAIVLSAVLPLALWPVVQRLTVSPGPHRASSAERQHQ